MIIIRLAGGLGNQLFQVMAGLLLAERSGQKVVTLTAGLSSYATKRDPDVLRILKSPHLVPESSIEIGPLARWLSVRARVGRWLPIIGVSDRHFPLFINHTVSIKNINFLDGYFQRGWTIGALREALKNVFIVNCHKASARAKKYDCIVHIRGGDFLTFKSHSILNINYYDECFGLAKREGCTSFGIVTDDPEYAGQIRSELTKRHSSIEIKVLPMEEDILQDFTTLSRARYRIIGNSTFAWWASALDENSALTWSPDRFVRDAVRDFYLPYECVVKTLLE
jgi:hypothetical protein